MHVRRYTLTVYDRREMGGEEYEIGKKMYTYIIFNLRYTHTHLRLVGFNINGSIVFKN